MVISHILLPRISRKLAAGNGWQPRWRCHQPQLSADAGSEASAQRWLAAACGDVVAYRWQPEHSQWLA